MKKLNNEQMENLQGGDSWAIDFCELGKNMALAGMAWFNPELYAAGLDFQTRACR